MLKYRVYVVAACLALVSGAVGPATLAATRQPAAGGATPASQQRAVLDQYCVSCHNDRLETGGLTLEGIDLGDIAGNAEL